MLFKKVFFLMLIVSHLRAETENDQKAKCNLIVSPLGYKKEKNSKENFCESGNPDDSGASGLRCCYQSYRIISSMTTSCTLIEYKNKDKFKEAKQLLKDNNAKNITIDCGGRRTTQNAISILFLFFFFLF